VLSISKEENTILCCESLQSNSSPVLFFKTYGLISKASAVSTFRINNLFENKSTLDLQYMRELRTVQMILTSMKTAVQEDSFTACLYCTLPTATLGEGRSSR